MALRGRKKATPAKAKPEIADDEADKFPSKPDNEVPETADSGASEPMPDDEDDDLDSDEIEDIEERTATTSNPPEEFKKHEYRRDKSVRVGDQVPLLELNREHRAQRRQERSSANLAANAAAAAVKTALGESTYVDPATAPDGMVNPRTGVRMRKPARGPVEASA